MENGFEKLQVWQRSMSLAERAHRQTQGAAFESDWDFRSQIRRASTSIPFNIAEGFERGSLRDSIKFYYIAKGSAGELRTQCMLAGRIGYLTQSDMISLAGEAAEISRMLMGLIRAAQSRANADQKT